MNEFDFNNFLIPFSVTSISQIFSGAFMAVKADMQIDPNLKLAEAFIKRYDVNNPTKKLSLGILNLYRGGFWNYTYVLACSVTGNNLALITRDKAKFFSNNLFFQAGLSAWAAGLAESAWTTQLVSRSLSTITYRKPLSMLESYRRVFPSLAIRDSLGWFSVQLGAIYIEELETMRDVSLLNKISIFILSGIGAAVFSAPADANLRRVFSDQENGGSLLKNFSASIRRFGLIPTITAGLMPRIASVTLPFIAYGVSQYLIDKNQEKMAPSLKI